MKTCLFFYFFSIAFPVVLYSQITAPVTRANFGVDADTRSNYFNNAVLNGNDDWFLFPGASGLGEFVIDTGGAAAIVKRYTTDMAFRKTTFARGMRFPAYSVINNRILLDAIMVRDFHGDDSTVFSGGNKNGDDPLAWSTPISQSIPDKNDLLDMLVHVRRAGPAGTDSLWMMGGVSLDNTTGNRYFDFEMYQTDLYYNRAALKFSGAGPDEGHTSWKFDAAGNIIKAGDIIFSAEYQSSSLTFIEARIWVNRNELSVTPAPFSWSGSIDGGSSGSQYGYASIQPKTSGTYYTGLQCSDNTWGGPFSIVLQNDNIATVYDAKQFVEFSVNLTKLGLDPLTRLGGDPCGMPFRRILVKTRSSASFTAELKDFIAPFAFFDPPMAQIQTATPYICNQGSVAEIHIINPLSTSIYDWTTTNGNIISSPTGISVFVDTPGTYIVRQHLLTGCSSYASDTIEVLPFPACTVLNTNLSAFQGVSENKQIHLTWKVSDNQNLTYFQVERSNDGINFTSIGKVDKKATDERATMYAYNDLTTAFAAQAYYRLKMFLVNGSYQFSYIINFKNNEIGDHDNLLIFPNPSKGIMQVQVTTTVNSKMKIDIADASGKNIGATSAYLQHGINVITLDCLSKQPDGLYFAIFHFGNEMIRKKIILAK